MRLKLLLQPYRGSKITIPINYNYFISSWIYQTIHRSSPEFSQFLHEKGYSPETLSRRFKHFTFSRLNITRQKVFDSQIQIISGPVELQISFLIEEAIQHFVVGLFNGQKIWIAKESNIFFVEQVETLPEPEWSSEMRFQLLSPMTVSTVELRNGTKQIHYYRPDEPGFPKAILTNAQNKYHSIHQKQTDDSTLEFQWDETYIQRKGGYEKISKLVTIHENQPEETRIKCFMAPFTLQGSTELIQLLYHSGIGEHNSQGLGMMEAVN